MNRISFADNMIDCDATKSIAPDISTSPTTALQHNMRLLLLDDCANGVEVVPPPPRPNPCCTLKLMTLRSWPGGRWVLDGAVIARVPNESTTSNRTAASKAYVDCTEEGGGGG